MHLVKTIPDKLFFKIGEVCELVEVQPHVLRYWESEFSQLTPQKNRAGQRTYRRKDVEIVMRIKQLLYDEGFTIAGAKKKLASELRSGAKLKVVAPETVPEMRPTLKEVVPEPEPIPVAEPITESIPVQPPVVLSLSQKQAVRELRNELQALLTRLSRDAIMGGKS